VDSGRHSFGALAYDKDKDEYVVLDDASSESFLAFSPGSLAGAKTSSAMSMSSVWRELESEDWFDITGVLEGGAVSKQALKSPRDGSRFCSSVEDSHRKDDEDVVAMGKVSPLTIPSPLFPVGGPAMGTKTPSFLGELPLRRHLDRGATLERKLTAIPMDFPAKMRLANGTPAEFYDIPSPKHPDHGSPKVFNLEYDKLPTLPEQWQMTAWLYGANTDESGANARGLNAIAIQVAKWDANFREMLAESHKRKAEQRMSTGGLLPPKSVPKILSIDVGGNVGTSGLSKLLMDRIETYQQRKALYEGI
jgi:hypothetical protein